MRCPWCGAEMYVHERSLTVACSDPECVCAHGPDSGGFSMDKMRVEARRPAIHDLDSLAAFLVENRRRAGATR